jgi:glycerol-3-phosphate dehydrogenase
MTISVWLDERPRADGARVQTIEADLAIIGGGIVRAATAYFAAHRAIKNIVVLEVGQTAGGAPI